jgi:hypothetical protein
LKLGKITTVQYLERLPDGLISDRDKLIEEIKTAEAEMKQKEMILLEKNQQ